MKDIFLMSSLADLEVEGLVDLGVEILGLLVA